MLAAMETASSYLRNISVVLVETRQPGNIGSTARIMKNLGLSRLKLVSPQDLRDEECLKMAVGAFDLIQKAAVFNGLDAALLDENVVIGTTSRRQRNLQDRIRTPRQIGPLIRAYAATNQVALVFGPERGGLSDRRLARCQHLVSIPSHLSFPVLNVAQSVAILAYEVLIARPDNSSPGPSLVTDGERQEMFQHLERVLTEIGFFSSQNRPHMMKAIRRLLGRSDLSRRDVRIVRGILSQMEWYAGRAPRPELE